MNQRLKITTLSIACSAVVMLSSSASADYIDFTSLPSYTPVTYLSGVSFSLTGGPMSSGAPTTLDGNSIGTYYSGLTNTTDGGGYPTAGQLVATFDQTATGVSFNFYTAGDDPYDNYQVYDSMGNLLATGALTGGFSNFYDISSLTGVKKIVWDNGWGGSRSWWQDVQSMSYQPTPEPAPIVVMGLGALGLAIRRKRK